MSLGAQEIMKLRRTLCLAACFVTSALSYSLAADQQPLRFWKDYKGREIIAELVASDDLRVTLRVEDNTKKVLPLTFLCEADRAFIASWRKEYPQAPWVDPETMPDWPDKLGKGPVAVKVLPAKSKSALFLYRSKHFEMQSDHELPLSVMTDLATIFETTRLAIHSLPLGLAASPEKTERELRLQHQYPQLKYDPDLLRVQFYSDLALFAQAGAPAGSGGFYSTMQNRTVLSLPNLGIKAGEGLIRSDYMKNAFILQHEITHHLLHDWAPYLPVWFQEGFAEYMGAARYTQGYFQFATIDRYLHNYLNRWRFKLDPKKIPMMGVQALMNTQAQDWTSSLKRNTPILEYNSAAILVHFFIHHDGKGNASFLTAYLNAIRAGVNPSQAENTHLLRGRSYQQIEAAIAETWQKQGVTLLYPNTTDPFK